MRQIDRVLRASSINDVLTDKWVNQLEYSDMQPKISVVVPVYNAAAFLDESIGSLLCQSLAESEFVLVDDCSTDGSFAIMEEYARKDARIKCIHLPRNCGTFMARKTGVMEASAPYVTFLDPDDALLPDACRLFVETFEKTSADIVHGGAEIAAESGISPARIAAIEKLVCPKCAALEGRAILRAIACEGKINPALWGKAYLTSLVKRANSMIPDGRYRRAQDYLMNFVVCCLARRYVSLPKKVYRYGYGRGLFGAANQDLEYYKAMCAQVDILPPLRQVVEREFSEDADIRNALQTVENHLIGASYSQIFTLLDTDEDRKDAFALLLSKAGALPMVEALAMRNYGRREELSLELASIDAVKKSGARPIRKVGIFYYHLTPGGVQRVITVLIPLFKALGREIVLILERLPDDHSFAVPEGVQVEQLPAIIWSCRDKVGLRVRKLAEIIQRHGIDMLYHHAYVSTNLLWDMLVCKWAFGIPVVIHYHTCACFRPRLGSETYLRWPGFMRMLSFADGVITMSRADERLMRIFGIVAKYIPNPLPFARKVCCRTKVRREIVWISRVSAEKHPADPLKILSIVRQKIPDVTLTIVGGGTAAALSGVTREIDALGLTGAVEMAGEQTDVLPYYERASVYLHTSDLEGFPMSVLEAASFGLPIVMYSLPWIEIVRSNSGGIVQVPQSDTAAAAAAIVSILSDRERADAMSRANQEVGRLFAGYDLRGMWNAMLKRLEGGESVFDCRLDCGDVESEVALARQFMHCYARGILAETKQCAIGELARKRLADDVASQKIALQDLQPRYDECRSALQKATTVRRHCEREIASLKSSESYRVGMFVTWPARKAWGGVKCLRENGIKYTVKHAAGKVLRLFGSTCKW